MKNQQVTNIVSNSSSEVPSSVKLQAGVVEIPPEILAIGQLLRTQDEQCTADAMFVIEQKKVIIGMDTDYSQGPEDIVWCIEDSQIYQGTPEFDELEKGYEDSLTVPQDYSRHGFIVQWDFVTVFFTEKDAHEFVARHNHKYSGNLRVTVECEVRNRQWAQLREWFYSLASAQRVCVSNEQQAAILLQSLYRDTGLRELMRPDQVQRIEDYFAKEALPDVSNAKVRAAFEAWYAKRHPKPVDENSTWAHASKMDDWEVWQAAMAVRLA